MYTIADVDFGLADKLLHFFINNEKPPALIECASKHSCSIIMLQIAYDTASHPASRYRAFAACHWPQSPHHPQIPASRYSPSSPGATLIPSPTSKPHSQERPVSKRPSRQLTSLAEKSWDVFVWTAASKIAPAYSTVRIPIATIIAQMHRLSERPPHLSTNSNASRRRFICSNSRGLRILKLLETLLICSCLIPRPNTTKQQGLKHPLFNTASYRFRDHAFVSLSLSLFETHST